jgi:hypothetical protein
MKTLRLSLTAALLLAACDFDVPNLNQPSIDTLANPTPAQVEALSVGLLIGARKGVTERVGTVVEWGVLGREALVLTPSDPRFINALLAGPLSNGDANFGGNFWVIPFANIRGANLILGALDNPALVGLSDAQKEGIRGFAKTIQALDYLQVADAHDASAASCAALVAEASTNLCGIVTDVNHPLGSAPPAYVSTDDAIYSFIETLLDDAQTHLTAAGTADFPFQLGTGFAGIAGVTAFDTPATFLMFNRALRARVSVYHASTTPSVAATKWNEALTALAASFVNRGSPLDLGVYHAFGAGSGDLPNDLNDTSIFCHDSVVTDAEAQPGGGGACAGAPPLPLTCLDQRVQNKVKDVSTFTLTNHSSSHAFTLYPASSSPIAIIRNEELILLRAEASIGLGNVNTGAGGVPSARSDINFIRTNSGLLNPVPAFAGATPAAIAAAALAELLNQRRYSLLFEGGHRWIDLRRYGLLDASHVSVDVSTDVIHQAFAIPVSETQGH